MCDRSAHCVEAGGQGDITEGARGEDEGEEEEETSVIKATVTGHQWRSSVFVSSAHF